MADEYPLGDPKDGVIMLCFVSFMAGINLFQEWRPDRSLQALGAVSVLCVDVVVGLGEDRQVGRGAGPLS